MRKTTTKHTKNKAVRTTEMTFYPSGKAYLLSDLSAGVWFRDRDWGVIRAWNLMAQLER